MSLALGFLEKRVQEKVVCAMRYLGLKFQQLMYIFDTAHLSVIDRGGVKAQHLLQRLTKVDPSQVVTTIISYEEQMRGWLSYTAKAQTIDNQVEAYKEVKRQLTNYCTIPIVDFDEQAA